MLLNANKKKVSELNSGLPDVISAIQTLLQDTTAVYVQKQQIDGYTQEVPISIKTKACIQPASQDLTILPEGQRKWKYLDMWCLPNLNLELDDIFWVRHQGYRILSKIDWKQYGFINYKIIEDYTDAPNITNNS